MAILVQSLFNLSEDIFNFEVPQLARRSNAAKIIPEYCLSKSTMQALLRIFRVSVESVTFRKEGRYHKTE